MGPQPPSCVQGWDIERICQETARSYPETTYMVEKDATSAMEQIQHSYGWDEPDIDGYAQDEVRAHTACCHTGIGCVSIGWLSHRRLVPLACSLQLILPPEPVAGTARSQHSPGGLAGAGVPQWPLRATAPVIPLPLTPCVSPAPFTLLQVTREMDSHTLWQMEQAMRQGYEQQTQGSAPTTFDV